MEVFKRVFGEWSSPLQKLSLPSLWPKAPPLTEHIKQFELLPIDILWGRVRPLGTGITKDQLERAVEFAKGQTSLTQGTRFRGREHGLDYSISITEMGSVIISTGKKTKESGGKLGSGSYKEVSRSLEIREGMPREIAELSVFSEVPLAQKENLAMRRIESPYVMEGSGSAIVYRDKTGRREKLALFQPILRDFNDLVQKGELPLQKQLNVLEDVARGLTDLHLLNITHGDLKLDNVLVDDKERGKITDFSTVIEHTPDSKNLTRDKAFDVLAWAGMGMDLLKGAPDSYRPLVTYLESLYRLQPEERPSAASVLQEWKRIRKSIV